MNRLLRSSAISALVLLAGCAAGPGRDFEQRRASAESAIRDHGLANDPAIDAARADLEAALAGEQGVVWVDELELRAAVLHERDEKVEMLARLPMRNVFQLSTEKAVLRADSELALAQLEEATLEQRVRGCRPSLAWRVFEEREQIFVAYESRQEALLEWNRKLRRAGMMDEVRGTRFDLAVQVLLSKRSPEPPATALRTDLAVLPEVSPDAPPLDTTPEVVRAELLRGPGVDVHRARGRRYAALSEHESAARLPSPRFVDFAFEPQPYSGDDRQYGGRIAFEIPFGFEARARSRRFAALAHGEASRERALVRDQVQEVRAALETINAFRLRSRHWHDLLGQATAAEAIADRWYAGRSANPGQVSDLLDDVYAARTTVLDARERAGRAGCDLLTASGGTVAAWPQ